MADIAPGLNFRISADVKGVQKAIREAEKSLRGAVSSFSSIGNSLSAAISLPIAAFTGISIKAAGELESLRMSLQKTMEGAGRSIEEANMELEELRKAALAPGLDFQQAVKGSIRLQGVGYQAEEARRIIVQLANALTLVGGTADQLDGVTKQFTQMIGKGKIMQEDLTIILENMPNLAKVMQDTFGTTNAEMLRKMGVSVEDFIAKLTDGMAKLPRAQGGIANAIVNAQNAIKLAIAEVGEEINKTFNITGALEDFAKWVTDLAKWFRGLSDETKRTIGFFAVFAVAIGPAFKAMQILVWVFGKAHIALMALRALAAQQLIATMSQLTISFNKTTKSLEVVSNSSQAATKSISVMAAWWQRLDAIQRASVIGLAVTVVLALGAAWAATAKDMSVAAQVQRKLEETRKAALDSTAAETAEIKALAAVAKDETRTKGERLTAMQKLIDKSPEFQKALDGETINTVALDKATNSLVASLIRSANARQATEDIAEIDKQLRNLKEISQPSVWQEAWNTFKVGGNIFAAMALNGETLADNMAENKTALEAQRVELVKFLEANVATVDVTKQRTNTTNALTNAIKAQSDELERVSKIQNFDQLPTLNLLPDSVSSMENPFSKMLESVKVATGEMQNYMTVGEQMGEINKMIVNGVNGIGDAFTRLGETMIAHGQIFAGIAAMTVGSMEALADSGAGIEEMGKGIVQSLKKIIGGLIKTGVTAVVTKALLSSALNPFAALALGAASGAIAQALFNSIINKIKVPALAEGGVLTTPQLLLAGEYAGARANPEIVTPENKMRDVFSEVMGKFGGAQSGVLTCRVDGDDLLFVLEKAQRKANRLR